MHSQFLVMAKGNRSAHRQPSVPTLILLTALYCICTNNSLSMLGFSSKKIGRTLLTPLLNRTTTTTTIFAGKVNPLLLTKSFSTHARSISKMTAIAGFKTTFEVTRPGAEGGAKVAKGATVTVHATGVVVETGKKFWSTKDPGQQPFQYQAGVGAVITGWDQGLLGKSGLSSPAGNRNQGLLGK